MTVEEINDRRIRRTRLAVFDAFRTLVLSRRYDDVRVGDIIETADVGRSTFYDHFKSKDDVLLSSIEPLFAVLAEAAVKRGVRGEVFFVLAHFWEQRSLARIIFGPALYFKLQRKLTDMIEERLIDDGRAPSRRALAIELAAARFALIAAWLRGEFVCDIDTFTDYITSSQDS